MDFFKVGGLYRSKVIKPGSRKNQVVEAIGCSIYGRYRTNVLYHVRMVGSYSTKLELDAAIKFNMILHKFTPDEWEMIPPEEVSQAVVEDWSKGI